MFKNIKIYQLEAKEKSKNKLEQNWSFGWKFEYNGNKYGNFIDNKIRTQEKLNCENQIAMLKMMIIAMEKIKE